MQSPLAAAAGASREQLLAEALRRQRDMQRQLSASLEVSLHSSCAPLGRGCGCEAVAAPLQGVRHATGLTALPRPKGGCSHLTPHRAHPPLLAQAQRAMQLQLEAHGRYIEQLLK